MEVGQLFLSAVREVWRVVRAGLQRGHAMCLRVILRLESDIN